MRRRRPSENVAAAQRHLAILHKYLLTKSLHLKDDLALRAVTIAHHCLRHRAFDLGSVACELLTVPPRTVPGAIITRALAETVAAMIVLNRELSNDPERAEATARTIVAGGRLEGMPVRAINVLTQIGKADEEIPELKLCYEHLCELAHPNSWGVTFSYSRQRIQSGRTFRFGRQPDSGLFVASVVLRVCSARALTEALSFVEKLPADPSLPSGA